MRSETENLQRYNQRRSASLVMSLLLHGGLLAVAVLMWSMFRSPPVDEPVRRGSIVLTAIDENQQEEFLTKDDVEESLEDTVAAATAAAAEAAPTLDVPAIDDLAGPPPIDPTPNATEMVNESHTNTASHQFELTQAELDEIARDQRKHRARQPKGDPISISVFNGTNMNGRRFVFIIDRSHSMGGQGLGVLSRAQSELTNAIQQLQPNHEFQIVAYHSRTVTISKRQLLTGTEANKALVKPFLQRIAAFGATEHHYGINAGLAFRPDSVVLLTDGGYPGPTTTQLKEIRKAVGKAEFHCIQFGLGPQQKPTNFMTQLASECNGTFRYIDVRDWDE